MFLSSVGNVGFVASCISALSKYSGSSHEGVSLRRQNSRPQYLRRQEDSIQYINRFEDKFGDLNPLRIDHPRGI